MKFSADQVRSMAAQARLGVTDDEAKELAGEISTVLEAMEKLHDVDTDGVEPTYHILPQKNVWRDDVVRPSLDHEVVMAEAPEQQDGFFKVPRVMEEA